MAGYVPEKTLSTGGNYWKRLLIRATGTQIFVFNFSTDRAVRISFPNHDVVHVVPVRHARFIVISRSGFQQRFIRDRATAIGEERETIKNEYQTTPPLRRDPNIDRRSIQLNRPSVLRRTIQRHSVDIHSGAYAGDQEPESAAVRT